MKIFSGTANEPLAKAICKSIGVELGQCTIKPFPDGETFVKIEENVRGEEVFVVQPTSPPTNHHLMELFIMMDALRRASAARITAVLPFYGYARQDRKDQPRVPITAKLVANLLVASGANRILAVDLHAQQIQGFFDIPVDHLYAAPVMYDYLKKKNLTNLVVVSPDAGGIKMAHAYSQVLEAELAIVAKRRKSATDVESMAVIGEIKGKKRFAGGRFDGNGRHAHGGGGVVEGKRARNRSSPAFRTRFWGRRASKDCANRLLTS